MALTSKDAVATAQVAAGAGYLSWHLAVASSTTFVGSARWTALVVFLAGASACGTGARMEKAGRYEQVVAVVGAAAFLLGLTVLVTTSDAVLVAFAATIVGLWLVSTIRHAMVADVPEVEAAEERTPELVG